MVFAGALLISVGALVGPVELQWLGFIAIGVGYGLLNNAMLVAEARLQQVITGPARATVTSVHGFATEVFAVAVYGSFVLLSGVLSVPVIVALLGVPIAAIALGVRTEVPTCPRLHETTSSKKEGLSLTSRGAGVQTATPMPDLVFTNGAVFTAVSGAPDASTVAVRDGRIVAVGGDDVRAPGAAPAPRSSTSPAACSCPASRTRTSTRSRAGWSGCAAT